jgi:TRAP-type uncharacterized transport system substrate-binding protein
VYNLKVVVETPEKRKDSIFSSDLAVLNMAENKKKPFEGGLKGLKTTALFNSIFAVHWWVTLDPSIKSLRDMEGKKVVLSPSGGTSAQNSIRMLKAAGVFDSVSMQHVTFTSIDDVLLDRLGDVGLVFAMANPPAGIYKAAAQALEIQASGRNFFWLGYGDSEEAVEKLIIKAGLKGGIVPGVMPAKTMDRQPEPVAYWANVCFDAVDATFPEKYAYELTKAVLNHLDKLKEYGGLSELRATKEFMVYRIEDILHPGAKRAYREAGVIP